LPTGPFSRDAVTISNIGETKAFPRTLTYGWFVGDKLPDRPSYSALIDFPIHALIEPEGTGFSPRLVLGHILKKGEWERICRGNYLWFFCKLYYDGFMDERRTQGSCYLWASAGTGCDWRVDKTPAYNEKT
jgi:hypothetical protein